MSNLEQATEVTNEELAKWFEMKEELNKLKSAEAMLRSRIAKHFFPAPDEGTNTHKIEDGTGAALKMVHSINRKVDEGELEALKEAMFEKGSNLPQLDITKLIVWKPEVSIKEYRKLSDEDRNVFDRALVISPGMPQLSIVIPKRPL